MEKFITNKGHQSRDWANRHLTRQDHGCYLPTEFSQWCPFQRLIRITSKLKCYDWRMILQKSNSSLHVTPAPKIYIIRRKMLCRSAMECKLDAKMNHFIWAQFKPHTLEELSKQESIPKSQHLPNETLLRWLKMALITHPLSGKRCLFPIIIHQIDSTNEPIQRFSRGNRSWVHRISDCWQRQSLKIETLSDLRKWVTWWLLSSRTLMELARKVSTETKAKTKTYSCERP